MSATAPMTTGTCPACAKPITPGADRCTHCGIALGEHQRCVHCRAIVDVDTVPEARFACRLCGGVRIPIDDATVVRSAAQIELLKKATVARSATTVWSVVAAAVGAFGVVTVLVLTLVLSFADPPTPAAVMAGVAACIPFAFAALAFAKSRKHRAEIGQSVEAAWMAAAADIARARGGQIDARTFAKLTRASESAADQILGRMSSQGLFASSVTEDGGLKYTILDAGSEGARALASGQ
ncbi:MAG: zinc ribbon domain-containing protein [Polyangiaceae bacterium]